jgi:diaminohydroxyphosphoribosylaminopyrimidine deaminase/5-amino-6-(5-phosphoribosylamino)uracil reductase
VVDERDAFFMRMALQLAERGRGGTSPNPMVGAVVVDRAGVVIGRGAHEAAGGPHAEVHALADAGDRARGATLYCTLEPCSHQGRTGPCAPLVVQAGITRAVIATEDPNPAVAGRGLALLRASGVEVACGVRAVEAARLNAPFFTVMRRRRPFVTMKIAISLDGMIAAGPSMRTPLTGPAANRDVHRLRAEVDGLAIGSGTMLTDDPVLTPRVAYRRRPLVRVIFDRRLRTRPGAAVFATLDTGPVIIVTSASARGSGAAAEELEGAGATLLNVDAGTGLERILELLVGHGVTSLVVEGGTTLHRAFWDAGLVDRVQMYVAPAVLGPHAVPWLEGPVVSDARMTGRLARPLGADVLIEAYVHRTD